MSLSSELRQEIGRLTELIRQDPAYLQFRETRQILEEDPALAKQTDDYREKYFALLEGGNEDGNLYYRQKDFKEENSELRDHREVRKFLKAEASYARLIQEVTAELMQQLGG